MGLAKRGWWPFATMTSRDFDLISAEPRRTPQEVFPELLRRYFAAYGPATLADAACFFGLQKEKKKLLQGMDLTQYARLELEGEAYYYLEDGRDMEEIPSMTLLSGFDPYLVSYARAGGPAPGVQVRGDFKIRYLPAHRGPGRPGGGALEHQKRPALGGVFPASAPKGEKRRL